MTTEAKKRANPDYAASAVMLTNPPQVGELLTKYRKEESDMMVLQDQMKKCIPQELLDRIEILGKWHAETHEAIRHTIDELGSYQDTAKGEYAVKHSARNPSPTRLNLLGNIWNRRLSIWCWLNPSIPKPSMVW